MSIQAKNNTFILSEAQKNEIPERDRQYEASKTEAYSLDEISTHFDIKENISAKIEKALDQLANGHFLTLEQLDEEIKKW